MLPISLSSSGTWSVGLVWTEVLFDGDLLVGERALLTPLIGDGLANLQDVKIKAATNALIYSIGMRKSRQAFLGTW